MKISENDKAILRELAKEKAEIAALPVQKENIKLWRDTNDLKMTKPPIFINEIPWHEMNVNDELTLRCEGEFCRWIEQGLRREIYSFKHFPGNMVVSGYMECPVAVNDSGFGIDEDVDIVKTDEKNSVVSRHFNIQISGIEDIEKIKFPVISLNKEETEKCLNAYHEIFDGILPVKKVGRKGMWFTPWDNLIRWTGVQEAFMDLILNPEYIEKLVERFVDASMVRLEQYEKLGVWASNNNNTRVGSGGYGYCSDLEPDDNLALDAPLKQLWGCGNAQIFSEVSQQMHWDFSLKYEMRWLERFGLTYYGCCEPLHNKLDILQKIPNLRKISTSPWAKIEEMTEVCKNKYVLSCKPSPAIFIDENWSPERARKDILEILDKSRGCNIELIMKDISTVQYKPQRVWEWSEIALETINSYQK